MRNLPEKLGVGIENRGSTVTLAGCDAGTSEPSFQKNYPMITWAWKLGTENVGDSFG